MNRKNRRHDHANTQLIKRYGTIVSISQLLQIIKDGKADRRPSSDPGEWLYDVPVGSKTVRCITNKDATYVITVLPPQFRSENSAQGSREAKHAGMVTDTDDTGSAYAAEVNEIESLRELERYWRMSLIKALERIAQLEKEAESKP